MKIKKLELRGFGPFRNQEIYFKEGLNIVLGPNESGKTTIHQFILGMFYGFRKHWTKNHSYREEEDRYKPLDGGSYEGALEFDYEETSYRIERNFKKGEEDCRVYDLKKGREITRDLDLYQGSRTAQVGQAIFSCNEKVFRQVYFMPQMGLGRQDYEKEGLRDYFSYIQRAASSGEVDRFFEEIDKRQKDLGSPARKKSLLGESYGKLREFEEKIYHLDEEIYRIKRQLQEDEGLLEERKLLEAGLQKKREEIEKAKDEAAQEGEAEGPHRAALKRQYQAYMLDLSARRERLSVLKELEKKGLKGKDRRQIYRLKGLEKKNALKLGLCLALSLGLFFLFYVLLPTKPGLPLFFLFFLLSLLGMQLGEKRALKRYLDLDDSFKGYLDRDWDLLSEDPQGLKADYEKLLEKMEDLEKSHPDLFIEREKDPARVQVLQEDFIDLLKQKNDLDQRTRDSFALRDKLEDLEASRQSLDEKKEQVALEIEKMEERQGVLSYLKEKMEGILEERDSRQYGDLFTEAGRYFSYLTAGRYQKIKGPVEDLSFIRKDGQKLDFDHLSQGSRDLAIFSIRLAMTGLSPKKLFLIMDESFNQVDSDRLRRLWTLLDEVSRDLQIIYFTSRPEGIYTKKANYIRLGDENE